SPTSLVVGLSESAGSSSPGRLVAPFGFVGYVLVQIYYASGLVPPPHLHRDIRSDFLLSGDDGGCLKLKKHQIFRFVDQITIEKL
ncbi:hypothetical protein U1Q18_048934, partial [Sarracenia purpurea var. burkii]